MKTQVILFAILFSFTVDAMSQSTNNEDFELRTQVNKNLILANENAVV